ncbi:hypothetical protein [Clostridium sp. KNHs205]|jgi:hypothetical protein|uniref:hypothetical protein n=1 Tax=Clostridium sp. KNHs205 TaxID=1449050 RepID=UPI00051C86D6|nr:hypothetical protein [Clostridium sp. KNHs205]
MLKLEVTFDEINYGELVAGLIPMILENLSSRDEKSKEVVNLINGLGDAPARMLTAAFSELPGQDINKLLSGIFSIYREDVLKIINDKLKEQKLTGAVTDIRLQNV